MCVCVCVCVRAHVCLGVLFMASVSSDSSDQFVYESLPPQVGMKNNTDLKANSYLGLSRSMDVCTVIHIHLVIVNKLYHLI